MAKKNPSPRHKKYLGTIGDMNPIEHGGGLIYDAGYGPEMLYFQSDGDSTWVHTIQIEEGSDDLFHSVSNWTALAEQSGQSTSDMKKYARSKDPLVRAQVYESVGYAEGFSTFDDMPTHMTVKQAERKYGRAVDAAQTSELKARSKRKTNPRPKAKKVTAKRKRNPVNARTLVARALK